MYDITRKDNDDDLIDALAYGTQMVREYLPLILSYHTQFEQPVMQSELQICSI